MAKKMIHIGHTNKQKYREEDHFVCEKTYTGFNHALDYEQTQVFKFVPKLISDSKEKVVWHFHETKHLKDPSNEDLIKLAKMIRQIHTSDITLPRNNLRRRAKAYLKIVNQKNLHIAEINDNWKEMWSLMAKMGKVNPCHNDLWAENILVKKDGKLLLVDWEYATMGDKHFDLAFFIESFQLSKEQTMLFLSAYNDSDKELSYTPELLPKYRRFVHWLTITWAYSQDVMPFDVEWMKKILNQSGDY